MSFFEKARTRLVGFFRNAGAGSTRVISQQDPAPVPSCKFSEAPEKTPEHDGQWLIGLGAKTQTDILQPPRDGDRSPFA
jgi:hypothetical protein